MSNLAPQPDSPPEGLASLWHHGEELKRFCASVAEANALLQQCAALISDMLGEVLTFLSRGNWREASAKLLRSGLDLTHSEYGFIGVVVEQGTLRILAHEGVVWHQATNREFYERAIKTYQEVGYLEFTSLDNLFGRVITTGQTVLSNDVERDSRSRGSLPPGHPPLRQFLGVPTCHQGEVVGMIAVANRNGGYSEKEQQQLELLAKVIGPLYESYGRHLREVALESQLRHSQERLLTVLEERESQAQQLHDNILQSVYSIGLSFDQISHIACENGWPISSEINDLISDLNRVIREVRDHILGGGMVKERPTIRGQLILLAERMKGIQGLSFTIDVNPEIAKRLSVEEVYQVMFIVQEAISNMCRHARATEGRIVLSSQDQGVRLAVSDNGTGFSIGRGKPRGLGLTSMRKRAQTLGGKMRVTSQPGAGTEVVVEFPLKGKLKM